ncbi:MAG: NADH-quinone oxidoreductase subunit NuoN [Betaproteobacteria bacterium]|jgi:NADH-quinone oxidoreductase subunit N
MINVSSWISISPEVILLLMTCVILLVDLGVKSLKRTLTFVLTVLTLLIVSVIEIMLANEGTVSFGFSHMVVFDPMGHWLKAFSCLAVLCTFVYARPYALDRGMLKGGELFTLGLFALLGMMVMISGNHFLVIYLGLEMLTLCSYALVALRRDHAASTEAAMKYFVLGALASGFLLYGLSMLYGATGSLDISRVYESISSGQIQPKVLVLGLVFVVCALAFKLSVVPFHMWVPDVYQGAPTAVTLMVAGAPKLAAFAITIRILVSGLLPMAHDWQQMLIILSVCSLAVGNLAAIAQTNLKRMLAFSTISQMGFVLIGLYCGVFEGGSADAANAYSSSMFYVITYVITTLAAFGVILLLAREGFESEEISDFAGLNQRSPLYAAVMAICLFSLAGVPPLVGFYAKLSVLQALLASQLFGATYLVIFALIMSLLAAFYYIRVIKVMYFDQPLTVSNVSAAWEVRWLLSINGLLILALGLFPGGLMSLCAQAIVKSLG